MANQAGNITHYIMLHSIKRSIQEICLTFVVRRRLWE